MELKSILSGFDGLKPNEDNYVNSDFINSEHGMQFEESNRIIRKMFENYLLHRTLFGDCEYHL
jgi:hypothetical protein